jgi:hypothetical protein
MHIFFENYIAEKPFTDRFVQQSSAKLTFTNSMTAQNCVLQQTRARGIEGNVVLRLKIPIELQRDYSGGLLLQIT